MQTIRQVQTNKEKTIIPNAYAANGWSSVLSHELNVLFQSLCYVVSTYDTKEEMKRQLGQIKALEGTFAPLDKSLFKSEESYNGYVRLLEKHKAFMRRSNIKYPESLEQAIQLFVDWGLLLDKGDVWDIPIHPFPDVQNVFTLTDEERAALEHIKFESIVHPIFSKLVLTLHEKDENTFHYTKAELKEMLQINDAMLLEVLIKLTPYLKEPIENMQEIPDDEEMEFTVEWERIYEDFLGTKDPHAIQ